MNHTKDTKSEYYFHTEYRETKTKEECRRKNEECVDLDSESYSVPSVYSVGKKMVF
jgi:hypothetical protein